jgi:hypothetical protein
MSSMFSATPCKRAFLGRGTFEDTHPMESQD